MALTAKQQAILDGTTEQKTSSLSVQQQSIIDNFNQQQRKYCFIRCLSPAFKIASWGYAPFKA